MRAPTLVAILLAAASTLAPAPAPASGGDMPAAQQGGTGALDPSRVRDLQQALQSHGFYRDGQVDGIWGPQTAAALREYQQSQGLDASGEATSETLASLGIGEDGMPTPPTMSGSSGDAPMPEADGGSGSNDATGGDGGSGAAPIE